MNGTTHQRAVEWFRTLVCTGGIDRAAAAIVNHRLTSCASLPPNDDRLRQLIGAVVSGHHLKAKTIAEAWLEAAAREHADYEEITP